ncbi:zinc ribbon domain-containing protein [Methanocella conradii]|uniref:zinc ribbon domain-containing protein n=1 Tax=Methanocella conradii TaxID=1175444 RepID=UPI0024B33506|nr:zinc ribbon domain-containing protein [Methanocella conradii]MDI6897145.1 zinc ribbon domain-containing protein [Methanocella conradii]
MELKAILCAILGTAAILLSLPVWFITLMALIAGRAWSLATGLAGLVMLGAGAAFIYLAYSAIQDKKMDEARYHNMERQVLALAKKNKGSVTVADLINVGFESAVAEAVLDKMAKKGICDINIDATQSSGITTYSFPTLIPFGEENDRQVKV